MKKLLVSLLAIAVISSSISFATVTNENRKISYVIDGTSEFTFAYTFDIISPADVSITFFDTDGSEIVIAMVRTIDSTPSVNEFYVNETDSSILIGGTGTLRTQYETSIVQLLITRTVNSTQESSFPVATALSSTAIEAALDKNVMLVQQLSETISRALVIPIQDDTSQVVDLPPAAERANQFLAFDGLGNPTVGDSPAGGAIISTTMQPFTAAATLAAARTLLEVGTSDDVEFAGITGTTGTFSGVLDVTGTLDVTGNIDPTTYETTNGGFLDEDDMGSNSVTATASQQSIKAYVDTGAWLPAAVYAGEESVTFPNGLIMKTGFVTVGATTGTITFDAAFPAGVTTVQFVEKEAGDALLAAWVRDFTVTDIDWFAPSSGLDGFWWTAWGY